MTIEKFIFDDSKPLYLKILEVLPKEAIIQIGLNDLNNETYNLGSENEITINELAKKDNLKPRVMLRVAPGVDPHTHVYTTTGILDTKFGFSIQTGDAELAIKETLNKGNLNLTGLYSSKVLACINMS